MRQTTIVKKADVKKEWLLVDANGQNLGKLSALVATILRGKDKVNFTANVDMGDNVVIINAEKIAIDPSKEEKKKYYTHSGYPGGLTVRNAAEQRAHKPTSLLEKAIKGMVPNTTLGRNQLRNLHIYVGTKHEHEAQKPRMLEVK